MFFIVVDFFFFFFGLLTIESRVDKLDLAKIC